jgi:hypothetical protein
MINRCPKGHSRLYFVTERSVPVAVAVSPDKGKHNKTKDCRSKDEL